MINLKEIISNYTKEEKSAFMLGSLYSNAVNLKKDKFFNEYEVEDLMWMIIEAREKKIKKF